MTCTADTKCAASDTPIFPQLAGPPPPHVEPFGVHFLCAHSYAGPRAFPAASAELAGETRSTALLAEELLVEQVGEKGGAGRWRNSSTGQMSAKMRRVRDLAEGAGRRGVGCGQCAKGVASGEPR